jgi:hypothetical protein
MSIYTKGPISVDNLVLNVDATQGATAVTDTEYVLVNTSSKTKSIKIQAKNPNLKLLSTRVLTAARTPPPRAVSTARISRARTTVKPPKSLSFKAREKKAIDLVFTDKILGGKTKALSIFPELSANGLMMMSKVNKMSVSVKLPKQARHIISSSLPIKRKRSTTEGIILDLEEIDSYPVPVAIKWTELDVNVVAKKSVRKMTRNRLKVSIRIKNLGDKVVRGLEVKDSYSSSAIKPVGAGFKEVSANAKDPRQEFLKRISLRPQQSTNLSYTIECIATAVTVPRTEIRIKDDLVSLAESPGVFHFPPPSPPPKTAFAIPSGWSFDFVHGGDHHINEHGQWCTGQNYNERNERLSWTTGAVYADKNHDDDFRWSTSHQILRFNPGYAYHGNTPWLAKNGNQTTVSGTFQHDSLKQFNNAEILIRGWRFDFTSKDHHINKVSIRLVKTSFNKAQGRINWRAIVTYADKNFDDNFRFLYYYTVLGFNGKSTLRSYTGVCDRGGTDAHAGSFTSSIHKNFSNAMVIPAGWSFDFASKDHHIDEHHFKTQNVKYVKSTGKVSWTAHLNYADKNNDDKYYWQYWVLIITTDAGEAREKYSGVITDDGGFDSKAYSIRLNQLFTPITWTNGIKDGNETGVDCGGSSPAVNYNPVRTNINPGTAGSSSLYSLRNTSQRVVVNTYATLALFEYANNQGVDFNTFYSGAEKADRYVEAIAWYVDQHMVYVADGGSWNGSQSAFKTLTETSHRGAGDFHGDCEDHAILRAALLRSLGFYHRAIFCADHHNGVQQNQCEECGGDKKKKSGGHTYNIVIYKGKYRIMDYGPMQERNWAGGACWDQHATDNIWNDHTGKHWSKKDVSPYGSATAMVNYPGNPASPSPNWDWRTYFNDITP